MKNKFLPLFGLFALSLAACGEKTASLVDYQKSVNLFEVKDMVRVMQFADLHWSMTTNYSQEEKYLKELVSKVDPDIIISTGDNVLGGDANTFAELFSFMDGLKKNDGTPIYWASVWGNHDRTGIYNPDYPSELQLHYAKTKDYKLGAENEHHSFYSCPDDNVFGRSNFVFNITDGTNVVWRLYGIDSNTDTYASGRYAYDHIHDDQIAWFEAEAATADVPSLCYFHIPLWETAYAYLESKNGGGNVSDWGGEIRESDFTNGPLDPANAQPGVYVAEEKTAFFDAAKKNGVKAIFNGHDHINDFYATYKDVLLAYGIKSGNGLYSDSDMIGAAYVDIHKDGTFDSRLGKDFHHLFMTYDGVTTLDGGDA